MEEKSIDQINTQRAILDLTTPMDHELMMRYLDIMCERYKFMSLTYIGESIFGRGIPMITLGQGKKRLFYIGAHSGADHRVSMAMLRFINEYCEVKKSGGRIFNYSIEYLFATRSICVIPMLNPDGVEINIHGVEEGNILKERILSMSGGKCKGRWQANARGVDIGHNYNSGFGEYQKYSIERGIISGAPEGYCGDAPESEPEVGALCSNIRFSDDVKFALSLSGGEENIAFGFGEEIPPRAKSIATAIARMSGYQSCQCDTPEAKGSLCGWCAAELNMPALEIRCGRNDSKAPSTYFDIYSRIREALFTLPALV